MFFHRESIAKVKATSGEIPFTNRHHLLSNTKPQFLIFIFQTGHWLTEDQTQGSFYVMDHCFYEFLVTTKVLNSFANSKKANFLFWGYQEFIPKATVRHSWSVSMSNRRPLLHGHKDSQALVKAKFLFQRERYMQFECG